MMKYRSEPLLLAPQPTACVNGIRPAVGAAMASIFLSLPGALLAAGGPGFGGSALWELWGLPMLGLAATGVVMALRGKAGAWGITVGCLGALMALICLSDKGLLGTLFLGRWALFIGTLLLGVLPAFLPSSPPPALASDCHYVDGTDIQVGDRVSLTDLDNSLGTIAAVVGTNQWGAGYSKESFNNISQGFLVVLDDGRKLFFDRSKKALHFIARARDGVPLETRPSGMG